jgi:hypothetical protein
MSFAVASSITNLKNPTRIERFLPFLDRYGSLANQEIGPSGKGPVGGEH